MHSLYVRATGGRAEVADVQDVLALDHACARQLLAAGCVDEKARALLARLQRVPVALY